MANLYRTVPLNYQANFEAFPFQREAFDEIKDLEFAAIFHEQGLGKTKIAIDLAHYWLESDAVDSVLFVTKKSLVENWLEELEAHSNMRARKLSNDRSRNFDVLHRASALYVTHYELVKAEEKTIRSFAQLRRVGIVLDESHKIKNPEAEIAKALHRLNEVFCRRVIMTGSPIANRPYDVWSQIWFLDSGSTLGDDFLEFKRKLEIPRDSGHLTDSGDSAVKALSGEVLEFEKSLGGLFPKIADFSVRETKNGSGIDLPKKHYENVYSDWESSQRELYETIRDEMSLDVLKDGDLITDISEEMLKRLLRLVQVTSNPKLLDESYNQCPGKLPVLRELIDKINSREEKVIVWTSFVENVLWLTSLFHAEKATALYGGMSVESRSRSVKRFKNDPSVRVLIATPQSSKEGLTLTVANHVIFFDRSFSLDDYIQAQDRIHRISQNKDCFIYNIIMKNSIEDWVDTLISTKQAAASYGQGDINTEEYQSRIDYDLKAHLERVLS